MDPNEQIEDENGFEESEDFDRWMDNEAEQQLLEDEQNFGT